MSEISSSNQDDNIIIGRCGITKFKYIVKCIFICACVMESYVMIPVTYLGQNYFVHSIQKHALSIKEI